ncbi:MAG: hypothetical protein U5K77_03540 [Candidatus Saccharibacteria bacterium]|nr:hypothetical protein [Candidatus Saccharibacteria bacterium]
MNKGFLAIIAIFVLVAGIGIFMVFQDNGATNGANNPETSTQATDQQTNTNPTTNNSDSQDPSSTASDAQQVTYDGSSFSPSEISISAGETVIFTNNADRSMWVASDTHPSHTDLPEFDSGQIPVGGTYSFTFEESGTWGYHNHLASHITGTVIVE